MKMSIFTSCEQYYFMAFFELIYVVAQAPAQCLYYATTAEAPVCPRRYAVILFKSLFILFDCQARGLAVFAVHPYLVNRADILQQTIGCLFLAEHTPSIVHPYLLPTLCQ